MNCLKQSMRAIILIAAGFLASGAVAQQNYPARPIRLIVPYAPGSATTTLARIVGQRLHESFGQPVLVENRPGGNTIIGSETVVRAPADGYSMLLITQAHTTNATLVDTPYDLIRDFAPLFTVGRSGFILVTHPSVPGANLKEFIAYARTTRPDQLNFASAGSGGGPHLALELFKLMTGAVGEHIPYKGGAPAITSVVAGQTQALFTGLANAAPFIRSGKLKGLAITDRVRAPSLPVVPTFAEAGLKEFDIGNWFGVLARAGTPKEIIARLSTDINTFLELPGGKDLLAKTGVEPLVMTPEQFGELIRTDVERFRKVIKQANIKLEE